LPEPPYSGHAESVVKQTLVNENGC